MQLPAKQVDVPSLSFDRPTMGQAACSRSWQDAKLLVIAGWGAIGAPATAALRFLDWANNRDNPEPTEQFSFVVMPVAGTAVRMWVNIVNPLTTDSVVFTLRKNAAPTAAQVTLGPSVAQVSLLNQSIAFVAGDRLSVSVQQSSTQAQASWACMVSLAFASPDGS